jgi:hypothetical protein
MKEIIKKVADLPYKPWIEIDNEEKESINILTNNYISTLDYLEEQIKYCDEGVEYYNNDTSNGLVRDQKLVKGVLEEVLSKLTRS